MKALAKRQRAARAVVHHGHGHEGAGARSALSLAIAATLSGAATLYGAPAVGASDLLGEVIVTARKREENLQDVPQSIDVYTSKDLQNLSITQFEDYATRSPSISFISIGPGTQTFFMRGVSDGSNPNVTNTSTTGFFVDDLAMGYYGTIPDLHMYDIERIEILNGPQGTLFGASSMSGAIRVITNKPDPNAFSAGVDTDAGRIDGGNGNYSYEGFVNIPLVEGKTALRMSAYSVHQGGFINNLLTTRQWVNGAVSDNSAWARNDYNVQNVEGARIALSQALPADWQLTLTGSYQRQLHRGAWDQDPTNFGDRNVSRFGPEFGNNYTRTLDLHVEGDVGIANLVYAAGYWSQPSRSVIEYSNYVQYSTSTYYTPAFLQSLACDLATCTKPTVPTMYYDYRSLAERWSHELRLESKPGGRAHWVAGAYWEKTRQFWNTFYHLPNINFSSPTAVSLLTNPVYGGGTPLPEEWYSSRNNRFDYLATTEFGDLTFDLSDRWSIEAGVEHFHSDFMTSDDWAGYFWQPKVPTVVPPASSSKVNAKAGINYKASEHTLYYFSFGQGFRDGGFNNLPTCYGNGVPPKYSPDTLNSFEFGWKTVHQDGRLLWNGAIYYMPWKNFQTSVYDINLCFTTFNANIGDARVYGGESNVQFVPVDGLTLSASASYNDSRITSNNYQNPGFVVVPGERLPYVPYFNFSAGVRYEWAAGDSLKSYLQLDVAHKGDMYNDLRADTRVLQPSYDLGNLRVGLNPPDSHWLVEAYVSNLWNTRAVIFINTGNYDTRQTTNEPRVLGVRLKYRIGKTT